ncbi:PREDICTED: heterogeneous nuclear ribonucleoprotein 27C isoform X3 [Nicrophorus vespilloides]|uniref:Heterogeneous nuclear ribonucleoprotein 27C isoform X3 n=1 Tax=Nicrophorus vespilloides TaxID=110193 RepID=A0ABM1N6F1_NICVS|nr:PREDICTED: heterogeneous nuclear ribonucleoprotein 27C isoform X3 [Nicrophorus vespilloides]
MQSVKLFVGGLSWETSQDNLSRYFQRYGEVIDCVVMKNAESGRSRGFGFVTFADPNNVTVVLQNGPHTLDGRTIDPKPCNPRTLQKPKKGGGYPKVFLGGLPSNVTETDLRTYFMRFGKVMEVVIMYDQEKKKSRGFGFLSFEDEEAVDRCVSEHFVNLNGKQVEIKKAEPRDGSGGAKMNDPGSAWGPPQAPLGIMQGPNGQMGGPPMNMGAHMGPNMIQSYQGWGTSPQQQSYAGYGTPSGPGSYQGWGAPPAPQGPPPQWGNNYGGPPQQQGYGSYGPGTGSGTASWNSWNMPQNNQSTAPSGYIAGDLYTRQQSGPGGPATPNAPQNSNAANSKPPPSASDYSNYAAYGSYSGDAGGAYGAPPRSYGSDAGSQVGSYTSQQQQQAAQNSGGDFSAAAGDSYSGGRRQRGGGGSSSGGGAGGYNANQQQYHPYKR